MDKTAPKKPRPKRRNVPVSEISESHVGTAEAAEILGISEPTLRGLVSELARGGREVPVKDESGATIKKREIKPSQAAKLVPVPLGQVQSLVWAREDIENIAMRFKDARRKPSN